MRDADDEQQSGGSRRDRLKGILEKLTSNRILGVLVGAVITAVIQSSSATTVMVVGFVNSGLMTLRQAVWIIMGANIGTTITGQLVALDIGTIAPLFAFAGIALGMLFQEAQCSEYRKHHCGTWGTLYRTWYDERRHGADEGFGSLCQCTDKFFQSDYRNRSRSEFLQQ